MKILNLMWPIWVDQYTRPRVLHSYRMPYHILSITLPPLDLWRLRKIVTYWFIIKGA